MENKNSLPKYAQGAFAAGYPSKKMCPNCGRRIDYFATECVCGACEESSWKLKMDAFDYDLHFEFISQGGSYKRLEKVSVMAKNGRLAFKSENGERKFFVLSKDFMFANRRVSSFGKMITLTFTGEVINMLDDDSAELLMQYIYKSIINQIYETKNSFFNAEHEFFPV